MIYESAPCDVCQQPVDQASRATAYQVYTTGDLRRVELGGAQPWIGVRVICPSCLAFFHAIPVPSTSPVAEQAR